MKAIALIAVLLCAAEVAAAQNGALQPGKASKGETMQPPAQHGRPQHPALPIVIPEQFSPPQEAYASFPAAAGATAPTGPSACQLRLAKVAAFKALPVLEGPGECGAVDAVVLESVILPDQAKVSVAPPATLRCMMAEQVALWVRDDVAPAALKLGAALRALENYDSYECRGRNRVRGATLSEHGRANAIDVHALRLADGETIILTDMKVRKDWREGLRESACARFSTVLGPGSDGNHEEHIHLDLVERRSGYRMCEWDVREPVVQVQKAQPEAVPVAATKMEEEGVPLPRPRPILANTRAKSRSRFKQFRWWLR